MSRSGIIGAAGSSGTPKACISGLSGNVSSYGSIRFAPPECDQPTCYKDSLKGKDGKLTLGYVSDSLLVYTKEVCLDTCAKEVPLGFFTRATKLRQIKNGVGSAGIVTIREAAFKEAGSASGFTMDLRKAETISRFAFESSKFLGLNGVGLGLSGSLLYLGDFAFSKCVGFGSVTIPSSLTRNPAFNNDPDNPDIPPPPNGVKCVTVSQKDVFSKEQSKEVPLFLRYNEDVIDALKQEGILPPTYLKDVEGEEVETNIDSWTMHSGEGTCDPPEFSSVSIFTPYDNGVAVQLEGGPSIFVIDSYSGTTGSPKDATGGFFSVSVKDGPCEITDSNAPKIEKGWGKSTFEKSGVSKVQFVSGVSLIPDRSFFECVKLSFPLNIPSSINSIGSEAFRGCSSLEYVTIAGRPLIGRAAFADCDLKSVLINGEQYIEQPQNSTNGVTPEPTPLRGIIEEGAFKGNDIIEITLNKVGEIGTEAFQGSVAADVDFDSSVPLNIGFKAFADSTFLGGQTAIPATTIAAGAFSGVNWL